MTPISLNVFFYKYLQNDALEPMTVSKFPTKFYFIFFADQIVITKMISSALIKTFSPQEMSRWTN